MTSLCPAALAAFVLALAALPPWGQSAFAGTGADCVIVRCHTIVDGARTHRRCVRRCRTNPQPPRPGCTFVFCRTTASGKHCRWWCPDEREAAWSPPPKSYLYDPAAGAPEDDGCPDGYYPVSERGCCPLGSEPTGDGYCRERRPRRASSGSEGNIARGEGPLWSDYLVFGLGPWAVLGIIVFLCMRARAAVLVHRRDEVLAHARRAEDLSRRLAGDAREADDFIRTHLREAYERGRKGD